MSFVVAIDGPAGSGKGTITKQVGKELGLMNIDTGATYRCVALGMIENKIELDEIEKIVDLMDKMEIEFKQDGESELVFLNGENVTKDIRSKEVTKFVTPVAKIKEVRAKLGDLQRKMAEDKDVIMEGRDIGTCVFPNADVKIYLDATPEERAKRRYLENQEKGIDMSYEEVLESIKTRDENDKSRDIGALKIAQDAIYVDSTNLSIPEVCKKIINIIEQRRKA